MSIDKSRHDSGTPKTERSSDGSQNGARARTSVHAQRALDEIRMHRSYTGPADSDALVQAPADLLSAVDCQTPPE